MSTIDNMVPMTTFLPKKCPPHYLLMVLLLLTGR